MRRRLLIASLIALPVAAPRAQIAVTDGASLLQQIKAWKQQIDQYTTQVEQLRNELKMYANMVTNTVSLPQSIWANVQGDIQQIRSIANGASLLTGNAGGIVNRLNLANAYANQAALLPTNIGAQFQMYQTTLGNADRQLARTLGVQQGQEANATALQAAIQAHSQTAAGQMQAIQAGNEMAGLTNYNLQQIHTTLVAAADEGATRNAVAAERDAIGDAYTVQFFSPGSLPTTGYPRY